MLVYRLEEFVGTGHAAPVEQGVALLSSPDIDHVRLLKRADDRGLLPTLSALETLTQRLRQGEAIETYELGDIARKLRTRR